MNVRGNIINNILMVVSNLITDEVKEKLESAMIMELQNYDIQKQCTSLIVDEDSNTKALRKFLAVKKLEGKSDATLKRYYEQNIKMLDFLSGKKIEDIKTDDIRFYLSYIKQERNLSNVTISGVFRCISSFFSFLTIEDYIVKNPTLQIRGVKTEKKVKQPLSDTELNIIRSSCRSIRDKALIEFLYSTGMRVSEVSQCSMEDINLDTKECIVKHGKGGKQRFVYLNDECIGLLQKYLRNKDCSSTSLFDLSKNGIEQVVSKLGKKNNIHLYPHKLRRTCATVLANSGMDIRYVASILGHSSIQTTMLYAISNQSHIKRNFMELMNVT